MRSTHSSFATRTILGTLLALGSGGCVDDAMSPAAVAGAAVGPDGTPAANEPTTNPAVPSQPGAEPGTPKEDVPPAIPGKTFALTGAADVLTGEEGDDVFASTMNGGFGAGDVLDGAEGNDSLSVFSIADVVPTDVAVSNIENATLTSLGSVRVDTTAWSGLTHLVTQAAGNSTVTAGPTTDVLTTSVGSGAVALEGGHDVTIAAFGAGSIGAINVKGGHAVNVQQVATNAATTTAFMGPVTVDGTASTTRVAVTSSPSSTASAMTAGVVDASVTVKDMSFESETVPGTITSIALSGFTTANIQDNALTSLSLTRGSGNVFIGNGNLVAPTNKTLGMTVDGESGGSLVDGGVYTTVNVTTAGAPSRMANYSLSSVTALNIDGTTDLTLFSTAGLSSLATIAISGSAGLTADLSGSSVTSITNTGNGAVTATIDPSRATFSGGSGNDRVTFNYATPSKVIHGGEGTDTLSMQSYTAQVASSSTAFADLVSGFEWLELTGATNQTIDVANLGPFTRFTTWGGNGFTLTQFPNHGTFVLRGPGTAYTLSNPDFVAGADDAVDLILTDGSGWGTSFASTGITMPKVETVHITTVDQQAIPTGDFNDYVTLLGNFAQTITVGGTAGLSLTATDTQLTMLDASGITTGGFNFWSGALVGTATIKGSAHGTNNVDASAATMGVSYFGGSGNDTLRIGASGPSTIDFGSGVDVLVLAGIPQSASARASVTGLGAGDFIDLNATQGTAASFSAQTVMGAKLTGSPTLARLPRCLCGGRCARRHGHRVVPARRKDVHRPRHLGGGDLPERARHGHRARRPRRSLGSAHQRARDFISEEATAPGKLAVDGRRAAETQAQSRSRRAPPPK